MSTLRELKSRIGSVASTQKTTSAMKMISSAKMRKATGNLQRLSPYRSMVQSVISHLLVTDQEFSSPLIARREVKRVALVVFGSDDGLCGAFNINIFKQLLATIADCRSTWGEDVGITLLPIGKKLTKASAKIAGGRIAVEPVPTVNTRSESQSLHEFMQLLSTRFLAGDYDRVDVLYMHFVSTSRQRAGLARDGHADRQRQCQGAARRAQPGVQQAAPAEHHHRVARHPGRTGTEVIIK